MLSESFYEELDKELKIIDLFNSLSASGKEVAATMILDGLERNNISPLSIITRYIRAKKESKKEDEQFINL